MDSIKYDSRCSRANAKHGRATSAEVESVAKQRVWYKRLRDEKFYPVEVSSSKVHKVRHDSSPAAGVETNFADLVKRFAALPSCFQLACVQPGQACPSTTTTLATLVRMVSQKSIACCCELCLPCGRWASAYNFSFPAKIGEIGSMTRMTRMTLYQFGLDLAIWLSRSRFCQG